MQDGFAKFSEQHGNFLTLGRTDTFLRDEAYTLIVMISAIKQMKNMTSGNRLPGWLRDLVSLLDHEKPAIAGKQPAETSTAMVVYVPKRKLLSPDRPFPRALRLRIRARRRRLRSASTNT